jgi:hypothetical protein
VAFTNAAQLDPQFLDPVVHLFSLAMLAGDTNGVHRLGKRALSLDSTSSVAGSIRWGMQRFEPDTAKLVQLRNAQYAGLNRFALIRFALEAVALPQALTDARLGLALLRRQPMTDADERFYAQLERDIALQYGWPGKARVLTERILKAQVEEGPRRAVLRHAIYAALYWDGDYELAAFAAGRLANLSGAPNAPALARDLCALAQWSVGRPNDNDTKPFIDHLQSVARTDSSQVVRSISATCTALLHALNSAADATRSRMALSALDSLLTNSLVDHAPGDPLLYGGNLVAARLHARHRDYDRALAAARRHGYGAEAGAPSPMFLTSFLLEEAAVATKLGDRQVAVAAYRKYLQLRYQPEPVLVPQKQRAEARLAALLRSAR